MNAILRFDGSELWHLAGWTMLHFLWLGTAIGAAAMTLRLVVHRAPASVRYVVALASLLLLAASPIGIAAWLVTGNLSHTERLDSLSSTGGGAALDPSMPSYAAGVGSASPDLQASETGPVNLPATSSPGPSQGLANFVNRIGLDELSADLEPCAQYLPWLWLVGTPLTFVLMTTGIVGAERLRRTSRLIDDGPIAEACARIQRTLHITRQVMVAVCERITAPVLVGIVRPLILIPPAALTYWSVDEIEMVLLHELAHVRRWDNLVNLAQRVVESLLFFHPAVWLVSRWVRREREACCDAVVVGRTERPHAYAELLVALAAQMPRSVLFHPAATSAMAAGPLRSRIRRILQLEDDPMLVSGKSFALLFGGIVVAGTLTLLYLPARGQAKESATQGKQQLTAEGAEEKLAGDSDNAATNSQSPTLDDQKLAAVPFVQGAMRFSDGDSITIREVRGTAATIEPGNIYWIKGTYTLGSHDRAALSAFTTAKDAANGTSPTWKIQTTVVERGSGTFTLCLPMSYRGWPHVSFYPADGGEGFGGIYFGTGDSVLKKWWGPHEVVDSTANGAESAEKQQSDDDTRRVAIKIDDNQTATAESQPGRLRLQIRRTESKSGKFPSLEDQKLADLAWKRLGLELESLGEADLKRVKALGYNGGVKVTESQFGSPLQQGDILVGLHAWPTNSLRDVADVLRRDDLAELSPLKFYVVRNRANGKDVSGQSVIDDFIATGRITVILDAPGNTTKQSDGSQSTSAASSTTSESPPVETAAQEPVFHAGNAQNRSLAGPVIDETFNTDPNMSLLNQQLTQAQYLLSIQDKVSTGSPKNADRLKKQIAAIQKQISEYRQQLSQRIAAGPPAERSDNDGRRKESELESGTAAAAIKRGEYSLKLAEERIEQAAKWRDEARKQLEQANQQHDDLAIQAAKPEYQTAIQAYVEAKRSFAELKQFYAQQKFEYELEANGEKARTLQSDPPRAAEEAKREAEGAKREAESQAHEAEAEAKVAVEAGHQEAEEANREAEAEAKQQVEEGHREAEEAKREAEAAQVEKDAAKGEAEEAERQHAVSDQQGSASQSQEGTMIIANDPTELTVSGDGKRTYTITAGKITIHTPNGTLSADSAAATNREVMSRALEQLHRQLEEADRQMEATKRQIDELSRQKETLIKQAKELAEQLQKESGEKQHP